MAKKPKYNEVYISGEAVDIMDAKFLNEGTENEAITFKLKVETAPGENTIVEYYSKMLASGKPNKIAEGYVTVVNDLKTRVTDGEGEMVNCSGEIGDMTYYNKGEKVDRFKLDGKFCNRDAKAKPGTVWKQTVLIRSMEEKDGYLEVIGFIHKYQSTGFECKFRVSDKELAATLQELFKVGDITKLEGEVRQEIQEVEVEITGFGSVKAKQEAKKNRIVTYLEITGGEGEALDSKELEETPFNADNLEAMIEGYKDKMLEAKEKDAAKNTELPF